MENVLVITCIETQKIQQFCQKNGEEISEKKSTDIYKSRKNSKSTLDYLIHCGRKKFGTHYFFCGLFEYKICFSHQKYDALKLF